ncbi:MAG: (Fe-S)-binding protein [Nitrososphaerales archaeon]
MSLFKLPTLQKTDIFACAQCGYCVKKCPVYNALNWESYSPRGRLYLLKQLQDENKSFLGKLIIRDKIDIKEVAQRIYDCAICGRCEEACHLELNLPSLWAKAREALFSIGAAPQLLTQVETTILSRKNVFGMDAESRGDWVIYTGVDAPTKKEAEIAYFVGCVTSYSGRVQSVAQAIASLLNHVGANWTLLDSEWCCGHPLYVSGAVSKYKELAEHNVKAIESTGAKIVVTGCPGCRLALAEEYPAILGYEPDFEVLHFTQLLDRWLSEGRLKIEMGEELITYHDPCELARLGGVIEQPRRVISSLTSRFVEPLERGRDGVCCGSGGMLKATNPTLSATLAESRLNSLVNTGSSLILSACPTCDQSLAEAAVKAQRSVRVVDLTQLIAERLGLM